jgi:hypothetical protein
MKKILFVLGFCVVLLSCSSSEEGDHFYIDNSFDKKEMNDVVEEMKEKGLELQISKLEYNSENKIKSIAGSVKGNLSSGTFNSDNFHNLKIDLPNKGLIIQVE